MLCKRVNLEEDVIAYSLSDYCPQTFHCTLHVCCTDAKDKNNQSALFLACEGGHLAVVEYLVEKANCDVSE